MSDELTNSRRALDKVTYTPLVLPPSDTGGALEMAGAVSQLALADGEADALEGNAQGHVKDVLALFAAFARASGPDERLAVAAQLAGQPLDALTAAVAAIRSGRERALAAATGELTQLADRYIHSQPPPQEGSVSTLDDRLTRLEQSMALTASPASQTVRPLRPEVALTSKVSHLAVPSGPWKEPLPSPIDSLFPAEVGPFVLGAADWAETSAPEAVRAFLSTVSPYVPAPLRGSARQAVFSGLPFLLDQVRVTTTVASQLTRRNLQPIGLLHLERLVMTPLEVERGELIYTLPLAPHEKVTLSHKEWTLREEEYSRFIQDRLENYSEQGVAETTDMATASHSETEHTKTLSMGKPMVPGAATIADPVNSQQSTDTTRELQSQDQSRRETEQITRKASTLSVKDQKISFTVTTVSGTQDFTARVYENPLPDKVMLVDYFRRMRKWKNELYRNGIRLTYDVVLPDPGRLLRERWMEVKAIEDQLSAPFEFEYTPSPPSGVRVAAITAASSFSASSGLKYAFSSFDFDTASVADLDRLARSYGTTLPEAPDTLKAAEGQHSIVEDAVRLDAFQIAVTAPIPPGYYPVRAWMGAKTTKSDDTDVWIEGEFRNQAPLTAPADGKFHEVEIKLSSKSPAQLTASFLAHKGAVGDVRVWADLEPTPETWRKWRDQAWNTIRQASYARYTERRDRLMQQRAALLRELQAPDALGLRRLEREQVMYLVLRWLFPDFQTGPQIYADASKGKASAWEPALEYGEYIKFVHQAIDWDNALVLLYPYFWDNPDNHAEKLYLDHPDDAHREFLRAGAARLILAIRPGYEQDVVSLLDKGQLGKLAPQSRFLPVIKQVVAENLRLTGLTDGSQIPEGEPPVDAGEPKFGELIGRWLEWTPTSALDMEVRLTPVIV